MSAEFLRSDTVRPGQRRGSARGIDFNDNAVGSVKRDAGQAKPVGQSFDKGTESDSLHRSVQDDPMTRKAPGVFLTSGGGQPAEQEKMMTAKAATEREQKPVDSPVHAVSRADAPEIDGFAIGAAGIKHWCAEA